MPPTDPSQILLGALYQNMGVLILAGLAFVAVGVLKAFMPRIKGWAGERAVRRVLDAGGYKHLHDLDLPSRNGVTQVDHVAMVGRAILVIETKNYGGWIFGEEQQKTWTASFAGGRSKYRFQNPLRQNWGHRKAVEAVVGPEVEVLGLVVFTGSAHFPKGMPDGCIHIGQLRHELRDVASAWSGSSMTAWMALESCVASGDRKADRRTHMDTVERAKSRAS